MLVKSPWLDLASHSQCDQEFCFSDVCCNWISVGSMDSTSYISGEQSRHVSADVSWCYLKYTVIISRAALAARIDLLLSVQTSTSASHRKEDGNLPLQPHY